MLSSPQISSSELPLKAHGILPPGLPRLARLQDAHETPSHTPEINRFRMRQIMDLVLRGERTSSAGSRLNSKLSTGTPEAASANDNRQVPANSSKKRRFFEAFCTLWTKPCPLVAGNPGGGGSSAWATHLSSAPQGGGRDRRSPKRSARKFVVAHAEYWRVLGEKSLSIFWTWPGLV